MKKNENHNHISKKYIGVIAGSLSGAATRIFISPFDVIKIRFQVNNSSDSIFKTISEIVNREGLKYLWGGNLSAEFLWIIYNGCQFGCYSYLQSISKNKNEVRNSYIYGSISGIIATIVSYPFDISRSYFANYGKEIKYNSILSYFKSIYNEYHLLGLFRGLFPAIIEIIPSSAIKFYIYELYCSFSHHSTLSSLVGGTLGGLISCVCLYPLDTVKKYIQLISRNKNPKFIECIKYLYGEGGILRFYKGCYITLLKSGIGSGFSFCFYNYFYNLILKC